MTADEETKEGKEVAGETKPDTGLLMGKYKTPDDVISAFREYQSVTSKDQAQTKKIRDQLMAAGFTIEDDGTVFAPAGWGDREPATKPAKQEEEDLFDPDTLRERIKKQDEHIASLTGAVDVLSMNQARANKERFMAALPEAIREKAGATWDTQMRNIPIHLRSRSDTQELLEAKIGWDAMKELGPKGFAGESTGTESDLGELAGSAERPGRERTPVKRARVTADIQKVHEGLGGKDATGMTLEEFASQVEMGTEAKE